MVEETKSEDPHIEEITDLDKILEELKSSDETETENKEKTPTPEPVEDDTIESFTTEKEYEKLTDKQKEKFGI